MDEYDEFVDQRTMRSCVFRLLGSERVAPIARRQRWLPTVGYFGLLIAVSGVIAKAAPDPDSASAQQAAVPAVQAQAKRVPQTNKRVLLDFWSRGCGPCVGELPKLVKLAKQYEQSDLVIIGWHESRADAESLTEFARTHGLPYALAIDREADEPGWFGALFKSFGVRGVPQAALIDRDGRIVFVGYLDQVIAKLDGG